MKKVLVLLFLTFLSSQSFADNIARRFLLGTLTTRSADLQLKLAAVHGLKGHIAANDTQRVLMALAFDSNEETLLRTEALKALVPDTINSRTYRQLLGLYQRETNLEVKTMILKCLYLAAGSSQVSNFLQSVLLGSNEVELKRAAAFGFLAHINSSRVANTLMNILADRSEDAELRVEALKSLYWYRNSRKENLIVQLAFDQNTEKVLRLAAVKSIMTFARSNRNRDYLTRLARVDQDQDIKAEALKALRFQMSEKDIRWFRLHRDLAGNARDPLADQ